MLVSGGEGGIPAAICSSWPLASGSELHPMHRGRAMSTDDAGASTLDDYVLASGIDRVDFIKLDVDGWEAAVLAGAARTIGRLRPRIVMEMAPCLFQGSDGFDRIVGFLRDQRYTIKHLRTRRPLPTDADALRTRIAAGSSMNVLCLPG